MSKAGSGEFNKTSSSKARVQNDEDNREMAGSLAILLAALLLQAMLSGRTPLAVDRELIHPW
jgi:hypothetical protein